MDNADRIYPILLRVLNDPFEEYGSYRQEKKVFEVQSAISWSKKIGLSANLFISERPQEFYWQRIAGAVRAFYESWGQGTDSWP